MKRYAFFIIILSIIFIFSGALYADTILFEHSGASDPTTEGWTINGNESVISSGAVDSYAWYVTDTSTASGSMLTYNQAPSDAQNDAATSYGWTLSSNLMMVAGKTSVSNAIYVACLLGSTQWAMTFDMDSNGDPVVYAGNVGSSYYASYTVEGGADEYHLYSMIFDPVSETADIFVDGIECISNYSGFTKENTASVFWGSAASNGTGSAYYNSVQFSVGQEPVPEPTTMLLLGSGLVGLAGYRRKFKKA